MYSSKLVDIDHSIKRLRKTSHRGPDNLGYWVSQEKKLFLGHNRLSIIDISPLSNQPMIDSENNMILTFNGEIYNFKDIREQLAKLGVDFKTSSDTEVIIKAIRFWGNSAIEKFIGMFAFCLYDQNAGTLLLARDRSGEKPLYYALEEGEFQFSSEVRSISLKDKKIDFSSLNYYLGNLGMPRGKSIYKRIKQLQPGRFLEVKLKNWIREEDVQEREYWNISKIRPSYIYDQEQLLEEFDTLLTESVKGQLQSDVPLVVLLSGGIDSTIVTSKVSEIRSNVNTFTVGFQNRGKFDESHTARFISERLATRHTELELSDINKKTFLEIIDSMDQPLADNSFIPVSLISKEISSKSIKVVLGGDGADEIFGGYRQYGRFLGIKDKARTLPNLVLKIFYKLARVYPNGFPYWNYVSEFKSIIQNEYALLSNSFSNGLRGKLFTDRSRAIDFRDSLVFQKIQDWDYIQNSCFVDFTNYLPDNILTKVDRASMQASLEVRAPFLDKNIIEFGLTKLPSELKTNGQTGKILLQKYLEKKIPDYPNFNVKKGFVFPINEMMVCDRSWESLFKETIFEINTELFNQRYLSKLWRENKLGFDHSQRLYSLFVFNRWSANNDINIA